MKVAIWKGITQPYTAIIDNFDINDLSKKYILTRIINYIIDISDLTFYENNVLRLKLI